MKKDEGNIERTALVLLADEAVTAEIEKEGVFYREYKLPHRFRFCYELTRTSLTLGFYDTWNGDCVKEQVWEFSVANGKLNPWEYLSDTTSVPTARRFVLHSEYDQMTDFDEVWDAGRVAAEKWGVFEMLKDFDDLFGRVYAPLLAA